MPATEDYLRNIKSMHKVFCLSAVALLVCTVWMLWADYDDEWRHYQRVAQKNIADRDKARVNEIQSNPQYEVEKKALEQELTAANAALDSHASTEKNLEDDSEAKATRAAFYLRDLKVERAKRDVARATYGLAIRDNLPAEEQQALHSEFETQEQKVSDMEAEYKQLDLDSVTANALLSASTAERDQIKKKISDLEGEITRKKTAINKIEPENTFSALKRQVMLWPIINGFNSPEKIQQDWLPGLKIDLGGMSKVDRFDRCRTCHYSIDAVSSGTNPGFPLGTDPHKTGEYPHPFASHPKLDLYLTSTSPHPLPKFGCTVCHNGQGSGTSFTNASHTPNDPHEAEIWSQPFDSKLLKQELHQAQQLSEQDAEKSHHHGWFDNHFWESPMHPKRFQESGCIRCHINVVELGQHPKFGATAPKVVRGWELVKTYGCFGCHEINGYEGTKPIGPDLRLEPSTPEDMAKAAADPTTVAGRMKKVGPSLRHIAQKSPESWVAHWTEEPKRFRPTTRMPQFFHLTNQHDGIAEQFTPVEIAAVAQYLQEKSLPVDLLSPKADYQPNAERGKELFASRSCAACHRHEDLPNVPGANSEYGPELSRLSAKLLPGADGFNWLYTWLRDPHRYHPRAKMPQPDVEPEGEGEKYIDPAADIAAFLLKLDGKPSDFKPTETYEDRTIDTAALDELVREFLAKSLTKAQIADLFSQGKYPVPSSGVKAIKGDEIELVSADGSPISDPAELLRRKVNYVGRKTISRYGCYGCHDIPNFEQGRPIGTALQDWGKKDRSRLAFEHIHEFAHHHGQPDLGVGFDTLTAELAAKLHVEPASGARVTERKPGTHGKVELELDDVIVNYDGRPVVSAPQLEEYLRMTEPGAEVTIEVVRQGQNISVKLRPDGSLNDRVAESLQQADGGSFASPEEEDRELSAAFFYESLMHHGRPGFIWQKLRQPRSYDYKMTETKPYDDRLKMPKFPFKEDEIEAIATFVLGLIAEPPSSDYLYNPSGPQGDIIKGEYLLDQFNCTACHMMDVPTIRYGHDPENDGEITTITPEDELSDALALLQKVKPAEKGETGHTMTVKTDDGLKEIPIIQFHGMVTSYPSPDDDLEDQEYVTESWNTTEVDGKTLVPTSKFIFPATRLAGITPGRGGAYAEWLAPRLVDSRVAKDINDGRQSSPPPLYQEGSKVQTPWLFNFLQNPERIRHRTVLKMPKFNMSPEEAQVLANYFAAVSETPYPYQEIPEREPAYLAQKNADFKAAFPNSDQDYLSESWKLLNGPVCIKCHFVGGRQLIVTNPADSIRGPNLDAVASRLRPDWLLLWLYRPTWITPYTSMPQNFPPAKKQFEEILGGDPNQQTIAVRDALLNYHRIMERDGRVVYEPAQPMSTADAKPEDARSESDSQGAGE